MKLQSNWQDKVDHTRKQAMSVIRAIQSGKVNEEDLEMLSNFVQFSLALMQMEGPQKWARAKMNAEIMSFVKQNE